MKQKLTPSLFAVGLVLGALSAEEGVDLFASSKPNFGWTFDNGAEFPGATGSLAIDKDVTQNDTPSLKLAGDFSKGGNYVQALAQVPDVDPQSFSFWLKFPGAGTLSTRIVDAGGKCHQIVFKIHETDQWQLVQFPLADFFTHMGTTHAVTSVARYENWGGDKNVKWQGPAKMFCVLLGRTQCDAETKRGALWLSQVRLFPQTESASTEIRKTVRLDDFTEQDEVDWRLNLGWEFPGAKGAIELLKDQPKEGQSSLRLSGDFTGGGAYVAAEKSLDFLDAKEVETIKFRVKSENVKTFTLRLVDGTQQCHQKKNNPVTPDWREVVIRPTEAAGGEHWGGANDGKWHHPARLVSIIIGPQSEPPNKRPALQLANVEAEVVLPAAVRPASFNEGFEDADKPLSGWKTEGSVGVNSKTAVKGKQALCMERTLERIDDATSALGPVFKATSGTWEVACACKSDLHSPDNSYNGMVYFEVLNEAGAVIETATVAHQFGTQDWKVFKERVEAPKGTAAARFKAQLHKTHGALYVDELSASYVVSSSAAEKRIDRILLASNRLGNMLFPEDKPVIQATVEAFKPLRKEQFTVRFVVRDYWGAEQSLPGETVLESAGKSKDGRFLYKASLDLSGAALELGKYYEVHTEISREEGEPYHDYTSLVRLPEAETRKHKPEEIPFTSRNWDNRIREYFFLSDRIGLRLCGIWGGWSATPPYKTHAPGIEWCKELGMGVVTGTPAALIERHGEGYKDYDEKALREGARNLVQEHRQNGLKMVVLGNEPHGDIDRARENVAAYRVIYDEVKKTDPAITVVGTSVGPEEDYFKVGFQDCQDVYNFHAYADYSVVPAAFKRYEELFAKYGGKKPIWSTELGLNSQGMTRLAVAVDLIKKLTLFFACGGENCSWFTILYPDPQGKARGSFGDAHCVFDCRYSLYSPRLDAVAYYNMVNGICTKKFVSEKTYDGGIRAFLFKEKEERCLLVLWREQGREDVFVPLDGVGSVRIIRIDGSLGALDAAGKGLTLGISEEPLLLLYEQKGASLPERLGKLCIWIRSELSPIPRGGSGVVTIVGEGAENVEVLPPPLWRVVRESPGPGQIVARLTVPESTSARGGRILVRLSPKKQSPQGELSLLVPVGGPQ